MKENIMSRRFSVLYSGANIVGSIGSIDKNQDLFHFFAQN